MIQLIDNLKRMLGITNGKFLDKKADYEFSFISPTMMTLYDDHNHTPQVPTDEMDEWLKQIPGKWHYIMEMGCLWGVGFYDETNAMAFKLRWT